MGAPRRTPPTTKAAWNAFVDAPRPDVPARMTAAEFHLLRPSERSAYVAACRKHHGSLGPYGLSTFADIRKEAQGLLGSNDDLREDEIRRGAAIDGLPNMGKSTLLRIIGRDYHREVRARYGSETEDGHEYIPVCYVSLPAEQKPGTLGLTQKLFRFYGGVEISRESTTRLSNRLIDLMYDCGTSLVLIDDLHYIKPRQFRGTELANHLKHLMNELAATFLFAGVGLRRSGIFNEGKNNPDEARYAQLAQRLRRYELAPIDVNEREGKQEWKRLLAAFSADLRLLRPVRLQDGELPDYLYEQTQGSVGNLKDLVVGAAREALDEDAADPTAARSFIDILEGIRLSEGAEATRSRRKARKIRTRQAAA